MLISMWSLKGGQGTSVTAALAAVRAAKDHSQTVRLVDLGRDQPAIFGTSEPSDSWLSRWTHSDLDADALDRAQVELTPNLSLLPRGDGPLNPGRAGELVEWLKADGATTVVDVGTLRRGQTESFADSVHHKIIAESDQSIMVTRACYLALRRAVNPPVRPTGVVLVTEAGHVLTRSDCERFIETPVVATVAIDPDIARAVDSGMLLTRIPKQALGPLGALAEGEQSPTRDRAPGVELD